MSKWYVTVIEIVQSTDNEQAGLRLLQDYYNDKDDHVGLKYCRNALERAKQAADVDGYEWKKEATK